LFIFKRRWLALGILAVVSASIFAQAPAWAATATTTTVASSVNPSSPGQAVSFTATVTSAGGGTPTGSVTFKDGATVLFTTALSGATAGVITTGLTPGNHTITATYNGDATFSPSTSAPLIQTVGAATTTTALISSVNPSSPGQAVIFTATVTNVGGGTPTGSVTFKDGATVLFTTALSGATAAVITTGLTLGNHTITATYNGDATFSPSTSAPLIQTVGAPTTTTTLTSSQNPSAFGQAVTFAATLAISGPTGTVTFKDGATVLATVPLSGTTATFTTSLLTVGAHSITATYNGDANFTASTSGVLVQTVAQATTATALVSSLNPSEFGKPVTFTATVTSGGGTPTGTVTFNDGGVAIGTTTLAAGIASFTTSSLTVGSHPITASYGGAANFSASTSPTLNQAVNTPADSLKLRALQVLVTPTVAQVSGQAISGAVDSAIGEAFGGGGAFIAPSASGVRFNFAADPEAQSANTPLRSTDPFASANGTFASNRRGLGLQPGSPARIDDTFNALGYAGPTKAPPLRVAEPREWLGWVEVRGATLDRWGNLSTAPGFSTVPGATVLYGNQVNLLAGLTRKFTPNFLVGVLGGYETFDYRSDALLGRLKGEGWTVGSYLGWKITQGVRFDAGVAYSGIGYDGTAGTAAGSFNGNRWLVTSGLTGAYSNFGIQIEPSARVYALWEHENAYTDTLGTLQTARDFSTGRASGGVKLAYPVAWSATTILTPYVGLYGDYYFNSDSAGAPAPGAIPFIVLDGWSARAIGGLTARFDNGAQLAIGGERSGIGGSFGLWTYRARASLPFGAQ
jgi:hypothetical protein